MTVNRVLIGVLVLAAVAISPGSQTVGADESGKSGRLQGTVYEGRRRNVVGATIVIGSETDGARQFITSSDVRGRFHVGDLPNGSYRVDLQREGYAPVRKSEVELRFPFRAVVEVLMKRVDLGADGVAVPRRQPSTPGSVSVRGQVTVRAEAKPLGDVMIRFVRVDGGDDPRQVLTARDGTFAVEGLFTGRWQVEVRGVGFLAIQTALDLGQDTDLSFALVEQPPDFKPGPLELMPSEEPIPPPGLFGG